MTSLHRLSLLRSLLVFAAGFLVSFSLTAAPIDDVRSADEARVAATVAGDVEKLSGFLSDELSYGHNDGRVQTKSQYLSAVASNITKYDSVVYEDVKFASATTGIVTMTGLTHLKVHRAGKPAAFTVRFLAVWREEAGTWRLLAYQSARVAEPASTAR